VSQASALLVSPGTLSLSPNKLQILQAACNLS